MSGLLVNLIIQIISGAVGGNVAAGAAKNIELGTLGNTIAGAIGGGAGGQRRAPDKVYRDQTVLRIAGATLHRVRDTIRAMGYGLPNRSIANESAP